jgi:hypothetical protein
VKGCDVADQFDPYYKWLGIPPDEQPPNYYRLLGLRVFESDVDAIRNAADQRMGLLKTFATSYQNQLAEELLNEIARARLCLLDASKKSQYDASLKQILSETTPVEALSRPFHIPPPIGTTSVPSYASHGRSVVPSSPMGKPSSGIYAARPSLNIAGVGTIAPAVEVREDFIGQDLIVAQPSLVPNQRRRRVRQFTIISLFSVIVAAIIGLAAGYFVLCIIDLRYDFLHLLANGAPNEQTPSSAINKPQNNSVTNEPKNGLAHEASAIADPQQSPASEQHLQDEPDRPRQNPAMKPAAVPPPNRPLPQIKRPVRVTKQNPPKAFDPLAELPANLPLPLPEAVTKPVQLAPIPLNQLESFELELIVNKDNAAGGLVVGRSDNTHVLPQWTWPIQSNNQGAISDIAVFSVANTQLEFAWSPTCERSGVTMLRNAVLNFRGNRIDHFVCLRSPVLLEPLMIDLNKPMQRIVCDCGDLPDLKSIYADVMLDGFPESRIVGGSLLGLKLGDERTLKWTFQFTEATLRVSRFRNNLYALEVKFQYQLPSGDKDNLEIQHGNRKVSALQSRSDPRSTADADALVRVGALAKSIHQNARIRCVFYCLVGEHRVELASSGF